MNLTTLGLRYHRFIALLTCFFGVGGLLAAWQMRREVWPAVDLRTVVIEAAYPGAGPEQVATLIVTPIERELKALSDVRQVTSLAVEGVARITVAIEPDVGHPERIVTDIRRAVDRAKDLPSDLPDPPIVREWNTRHDPVMAVALWGLPEEALQAVAQRIEAQLLPLPGVGKVERVGWRNRQIEVAIAPERLREYRVTVEEVIAALRQHNVNIPGGPLVRGDAAAPQELLLRTSGELTGPEDVAAVVVRANDLGRHIRVDDVALVRWTFATATAILRSSGTRAVMLNIVKRPRADAVTLARAVRQVVTAVLDTTPAGPPPRRSGPRLGKASGGAWVGHAGELQVAFPHDVSADVERRLRVLLINGTIGLALVIGIVCYFLSREAALGAAIGIPIALVTACLILYWVGASLNLVTLFGLLICIGMLIDAVVVITENVHRYGGAGGDLQTNIVRATGDASRSICTTAAMMIAAVVPLLFVEGIIGPFVRWVPWVVIITLAASLAGTLVLLPTHLYYLFRRRGTIAPPRALPWLEQLQGGYHRALHWAVAHRAVAGGMLAAVGCLGAGLAAWRLPFVLFPPHGVEFFFVRAEASPGTPLETMERLIAPLEAAIATLPPTEVATAVTTVGMQQAEPNDPLTRYGSHLAQATVYLTPAARRARAADAILDDLRRRIGAPPGLLPITFARVNTGPYVGRPVAIQLRGEDPTQLAAAAQALRTYLGSLPGVTDIADDLIPGKRELRVEVDEATARQAGLSMAEVSRAVRAVFAGETATTIKQFAEEIDVVVRYPESIRSTAEGVRQVMIENARGQSTPLLTLATMREAAGPSVIRHVDYRRAVTITADLDTRRNSPLRIHRSVAAHFAALAAEYPGVILTAGGEIAASQESRRSGVHAMVAAVLLIVGILLAVLPSLASCAAVLSALLFGALGVGIGLTIMGGSVTCMTLVGTIGCFGAIVNGALMIVTLADRLRRNGRSAHEAILEACRIRFRPLVLVTLATTLALLPAALGIGGADLLIQPTACAIVWGIALGTALALFGVPLVYVGCVGSAGKSG